ncbi:MAG TPA: hypothetical protein VHS99_26120 [Chloroflexota bacterium]|nr:hypothetical protein [Chloroflexota bacterium]
MSDRLQHVGAEAIREGVVDLDALAARVRRWYESLHLPGRAYGSYRLQPYWGSAPQLYSVTDLAITRWVMGEDLHALPQADRTAWVEVINGFQRAEDGTYRQDMHAPEHANGMALNALAILGGQHRYPVQRYERLATPDRLRAWLESLDFSDPWNTSHLVWGLTIPYSHSRRATPEWHRTLFDWLDETQDPRTGWWRKGVPPAAGKPKISGLGGAVHIFPLHRHHGRPVPHLERMVEEVLRWHREDGFMTRAGGYGEMDGAYVLTLGAEQLPVYRDACRAAGQVWLDALVREYQERPEWFFGHAHTVLCYASGLGYLQRLLPHRVVSPSGTRWRDIFDHPEIYRLDQVWPHRPPPEAAGRWNER